MPCDLIALKKIASKHSLPLIEDAACALGSEVLINEWQKIGRPHGDIACFSFHPRKIVTTGDGGMLTTLNSQWDKQFRLLRNHGLSAESSSYEILGFNYRMTDIQAAIGKEQLKRLPWNALTPPGTGRAIQEALTGIAGLKLPAQPVWAKSNWQSFCVGLPPGSSQATVMSFLGKNGISTRPGVPLRSSRTGRIKTKTGRASQILIIVIVNLI